MIGFEELEIKLRARFPGYLFEIDSNLVATAITKKLDIRFIHPTLSPETKVISMAFSPEMIYLNNISFVDMVTKGLSKYIPMEHQRIIELVNIYRDLKNIEYRLWEETEGTLSFRIYRMNEMARGCSHFKASNGLLISSVSGVEITRGTIYLRGSVYTDDNHKAMYGCLSEATHFANRIDEALQEWDKNLLRTLINRYGIENIRKTEDILEEWL